MPGRVLAEILDAPVPDRVPTWEPETPRPRVTPGPDAEDEAAAAEQEALRQLVALGYVEDAGDADLATQARRDGQYYLAKVLLARGRAAEAAETLAALCDEAGLAFYGPWLVHARLHAGQTAQAEADLARVEGALGPDSDAALGLLQAEIALRRGRTDEAIARLDALAEAAPDDPERHLARARTLAAAGHPEDAEQACAAVLRLDPENARAHALLADLLLGRGDAEGAAEAALEAVGRLYELTAAHLTLGRAFETLGVPERATHAYLVVAAQAPMSPIPHHELARVYTRTGRPELAARHTAHAIELGAAAAARQAFGQAPEQRRT